MSKRPRGSIEVLVAVTQISSMEQESSPPSIVDRCAALLSSAVNETAEGIGRPLQSAAEQLPSLFVETTEVCCKVPSLELLQEQTPFLPKSSRCVLEEAAACNLRIPLACTRQELPELPSKLLWNLARSFLYLVDSRLRACLCAIARQQRSDRINRILMELLGDHNPVTPTTIVTTFHTLEGNECVLPLIFQTVLDFRILGQQLTVQWEVPGAINGQLAYDGRLTSVEVMLDTAALLQQLMNEARTMVNCTLQIATALATTVVAEERRSVSAPSITESTYQSDSSSTRRSLPSLRLDSICGGPASSALQNALQNQDQGKVQSDNPLSSHPSFSGLTLLTAAMTEVRRTYGKEEEESSSSPWTPHDNKSPKAQLEQDDISKKASRSPSDDSADSSSVAKVAKV